MHDRDMFKFITILLLVPLIAFGNTITSRDKGEFTWKYQAFIGFLEGQNWQQLSIYESVSTKCGFGPGEEGKGCIKKAIATNHGCISDMLLSLKQGCKLETNTNNITCTSPPQWADDEIIVLGARANFTYNTENKSVIVTHFICGGD